MTTEAEFLKSYEIINSSYREIMQELDIAIGHEESDRPAEAIKAYEQIMQQIDETFAIPVGIPDNPDAMQAEWNFACTIIQKLKGAKAEIAYRLKVLRVQLAPVDKTAEVADEENGIVPAVNQKSVLLENPQTYYDIKNGTGRPRTYKQIIKGLREVIATKDCGVSFDTLFQSQVKLYKIQQNGVVSTMAGETSMSLVMCNVGGKWHYLNGIFFIQCAIPADTLQPSTSTAAQEQCNMIWIYPLIPNVTNCYRTDYDAYILPDLEAEIAGTAFGLVLTGSTATSVDGTEATAVNEEAIADMQLFFLELLEAVLAGSVEILGQPGERAARNASEQVSRHIVCAADFIARNLVKGAEKTGELMGKSTPYLISKMEAAPADAPSPVSSSVQTSVEVAKTATSAAVGVTSWLANKVGSASMSLGRFLAPHIQTQGSNLLQMSFGMDSNSANSKMEGAMTIAAGAVEGFSTVYNGLESSAKILGNNLSQNSVKIIEHRYGSSAGNLAADTFETIGNAFNVSQNVNYITPKGIAKKMVKNTGKAVVFDIQQNLRDDNHFVPAGSLYPNLRELNEKKID